MPAALDVDWSAVQMLAIQIGVREAARKLGISEDAVMQRSKREGWLRDLPRSQPLPPTVRQAVSVVSTPQQVMAQELASLNAKSRLGMARGLQKAAAHVEALEGPAILADASNVKQTVQSLALVHGWAANAPVTKVELRVTAVQGDVTDVPHPAGPIEAEWCDVVQGVETQQ